MVRWLLRQWREHTPETAFLMLGVVFGLFFLVLTPPTQAADETTHFYRAYQFAQGNLLAEQVEEGWGGTLPRDTQTVTRQLFADIPSHYERKFDYAQILHLLKERIDFKDTTHVHFEGATIYSPAGYIPQIIAIALSKFTWPSVVGMYYAGRVLNLATWLAIMYLAIRIWPGNKWAIFALALIPMSLSQAATLSPDVTINSMAFLAIAGACYFVKRNRALNYKEVLLSFGVVMMLSLCKPVLFVLAFLGLLIGPRKFGGMRRYLLFTGGLLLAGIAVTALWNSLIQGNMEGIRHYYYPNVDVDEGRQLLGIVSDPLHYLSVLVQTFVTSVGDLMTTTFIGRLGWWDVDMPLWVIVSCYVLVVLAIINREPGEKRLPQQQRILAGVLFGIGFMAIATIFYLTATKVGEDFITGLQGRYFMVFAPLLAIAFAGVLEVKHWNTIAPKLFIGSYAVLLTTSLIVMVNRFI